MQWWHNLSVKTKFLLGIVVIGVITSISSCFFLLTLYSLNKDAQHLNNVADLNESFITRQVQHLQWVNSLSSYLISDTSTELAIAKDPTQCGFGKWYYSNERQEVMQMFPELRQSLIAIEQAHKDLHVTAEKIQTLKQNGNVAEARKIFYGETIPALAGVEKHLTSLSASLNDISNAEQETFIKRVNFSLLLTLALGALGMVSVIILAFVLFKSILKPIQALKSYAEECRAGRELEAPLKNKDELGTLSAVLSDLMSHLTRELAFSQGVLRGLSIPCSIFSSEDKTVFTNQRMLDLIERNGQPDDYVGMSSGEYIWGDPGKETLSTKALRENRTLTSEIEFKTHKGHTRNAAVSSSPFWDKHGAALGTISVWIDMTEIISKQRMIEENSKRITEVASSATEVSLSVSSSSTEISVQVEEASQGASIQRDRVNETVSAMTQMSASAQEVAQNASKASDTAAEARDKAQEGARTMERVVASVATVGARANDMKTGMDSLGRQADGIGAIINVINDIADQTNLLALNAAIEAARAGEAGRGFAVVADEVRKLAEKTVLATKEVSEVISGIQKGTHTNIQNVEMAAEAIGETSSLADEAGVNLGAIVALVENVSNQIQSIAIAAREQTSVTVEINSSLEEVSRISDDTSSAMRESAKAVEELAAQAENLQGLINRLQG